MESPPRWTSSCVPLRRRVSRFLSSLFNARNYQEWCSNGAAACLPPGLHYCAPSEKEKERKLKRAGDGENGGPGGGREQGGDERTGLRYPVTYYLTVQKGIKSEGGLLFLQVCYYTGEHVGCQGEVFCFPSFFRFFGISSPPFDSVFLHPKRSQPILPLPLTSIPPN